MWRILLSVSLVASVASAQDCVLDTKSIVPQFSAKLPKGAKLLSTKKDKRRVKQTLKLDAFEVTVDFGGCEKVQYSFAIKGGGLNTKTVGAEVVAVAKRVLPQLPMNKDAMAEPKVLLTALEEQSFTSLPATVSCASAGTCRIELVPEPKKGAPAKKAPKAKEKDKDKKDEEPKVEEPEGPASLVLSYESTIN